MSPPIAGHVYDGSPEQALSYMKDVDYQTDIRTLSSFWEGFHDPHSTIKTYYVSVGSCSDCEDVLTNQDIGISNSNYISILSKYPLAVSLLKLFLILKMR
jgi:hypothetical protein